MTKHHSKWHQCKIGELLKEHSERSSVNNQHEVLSVTKEGIFSQQEYFKKQIASEDNSGYKIVKKGDVVFSAMNLWMGSIDVVKNHEIGIVSPAYITMRPDENLIHTEFLSYFLRGEKMMKKYIYHSQQGASIVRRNLNKDDLLQDKISIPPINEQSKIAEILTGIDKKISLSRQKVEKMGYLLKALFNSESLEKGCKSLVPLSEIGVWRGGGTPSKSIREYWKGSIPWVSPKDMIGNRIYDTQDHITSKAIENSSALLIKKGSILFVVRSGILRNKLPIAFAEKDLTINQDLKSLQINSQWDKDFIFYFLKSNSDKIRTSCMKVGTTVESIASDLLMEYMIPSVSKLIQENLGKVARRIDQSMEFENYSIDSIIRLKNALLQDLLSGSKRVEV